MGNQSLERASTDLGRILESAEELRPDSELSSEPQEFTICGQMPTHTTLTISRRLSRRDGTTLAPSLNCKWISFNEIGHRFCGNLLRKCGTMSTTRNHLVDYVYAVTRRSLRRSTL
jgi:hypothetical protein